MPRVPAHFHRQRRTEHPAGWICARYKSLLVLLLLLTVFDRRLRFYSSLDPAQVLARKTCLFSIRFVLNGHLFNLTIVRLLNPIDI